MAECAARNCAMANKVESCVQCKALAVCGQEFWKEWPRAYDFTMKMQRRYMVQPGAVLIKAKPMA